MKKRGQKAVPGSAAAALIGIITIIIIFYIILIPPAEREKLLADETIKEQTGNVLLQEYIGRLTAEGKDKHEHKIPNIFLKEVTEATVLAQENDFMIKKGITALYKTINFFLEDPEYVDNAIISFNTPTHEGTLKIIFNGYTVFEGSVYVESPQPIRINKQYLEENNKVELQVHGFGVPAKIYSFENFRIIGDITNVKKQEASHLISISETEKDQLETAYIDYMAMCNQQNIGALELILNDKEIYSGVPGCNSPARTDLYLQDLTAGTNEIKFRLLQGTITLEQIKLKTFMKTKEGWSRYFYITKEQYDKIQKNTAMLEIEFYDDGYSKEAEISLNGELQRIEQKEPYFIRDISAIIKQGNNHISIKPEKDINILEIEVRIE